MTPYLAGVAQAAIESFPCPGPILEVGSYQVAGQSLHADLRPFFPEQTFVGIDMRSGPGVDQVANVERLPFADNSFGTVLAFSVFEHVERFWQGFAEVQRVLRPDGLFLLSCPFYFHIHAHPEDYWRFTPSSFDSLLQEYPSRLIGSHGPASRPLNVWAIAAGPEYPPFTEDQKALFEKKVQSYARQPLRTGRKIRYQIAKLLCGGGPFAPKLKAETFRTEIFRTPSPATTTISSSLEVA
ncbi:Class I SAM-dependent methyltransferase [Planctomycetales bacterium 10988]|nr:Class I SAM-dependent methyltransferase [Planctomycetales bacterium 10988]